MVSEDQFSFPILSNPMSHLMQASSLWRITSRVYHSEDFDHENGHHGQYGNDDIKSKEEAVESSDELIEEKERGKGEDKMDMLWEDFNEQEKNSTTMELSNLESTSNKKKATTAVAAGREVVGVGRGCITSSANKDASKGVVVVKLFKRFLSLRNRQVHGMSN